MDEYTVDGLEILDISYALLTDAQSYTEAGMWEQTYRLVTLALKWGSRNAHTSAMHIRKMRELQLQAAQHLEAQRQVPE